MITAIARLRRTFTASATIKENTIAASATLKKTAHLDMTKIAMAPDDGVHGVIIGAIDDSNQAFTLPGAYAPKKLLVFYNGLQEGEIIETDPAAGVFTFNFAPEAGSKITAAYV